MGGEKVVCTTFAAVIYLHKEVANSQRYMRGMERRNYMCSTVYFFFKQERMRWFQNVLISSKWYVGHLKTG